MHNGLHQNLFIFATNENGNTVILSSGNLWHSFLHLYKLKMYKIVWFLSLFPLKVIQGLHSVPQGLALLALLEYTHYCSNKYSCEWFTSFQQRFQTFSKVTFRILQSLKLPLSFCKTFICDSLCNLYSKQIFNSSAIIQN